MTQTTAPTDPYPDIVPPAGATADIWEGTPPERIVYSASRGIPDYEVNVWTSANQFADGTLDDGSRTEPPTVHLEVGASTGMNSDQARILAAVLIESADEIDGWATR
jgi:hypothetical protein